MATTPNGTQYDWYNDPTNPWASSYYGTPSAPGYQAGFDPNSMSMAPAVEARLAALNMDMRGVEKFRGEALRNRPSAWAGLMQNRQFAEEAGARDRARAESRSAVRQGEADLASKGGLSSGARERLARRGASDLLAVGQDVSRQGNLNRMQIGIQDETNRIQNLSQLPGIENMVFQTGMQKENVWNNARDKDIARITAENQNRNQYNQNLYNQQMQAWAAQQQAAATENAGKK